MKNFISSEARKLLQLTLTLILGLVLSGSGCTPQEAPEVGVKINDVTWATRNVAAIGRFAANPEDVGMMFQWNRLKAWPVTGATFGWDNSIDDGITWVTVLDPCPEGWRVPTKAELESLITATNTWVRGAINGRRFISGDNTIFLPAAGWLHSFDGASQYKNSRCAYWSSTKVDANRASYMSSDELNNAFMDNADKSMGFSIRCVKK